MVPLSDLELLREFLRQSGLEEQGATFDGIAGSYYLDPPETETVISFDVSDGLRFCFDGAGKLLRLFG